MAKAAVAVVHPDATEQREQVAASANPATTRFGLDQSVGLGGVVMNGVARVFACARAYLSTGSRQRDVRFGSLADIQRHTHLGPL